MTPRRALDTSDWPTKADVARKLGCAEKTIERLVGRGKLRQEARANDVEGKRAIVVYNPEDVAALCTEMQALAVLAPPAELAAGNSSSVGPANMAAFLESLRPPAPPAVAIEKKLYLTLAEAAEYSGLPEGLLLAAIHQNPPRLEAIKWGRWCIKRASLEAAVNWVIGQSDKKSDSAGRVQLAGRSPGEPVQ